MKSIYKYSLVALAVVGLSACNQAQEAVAAPVELKTDAQKEAYSVGASIGTYMAGHIKEQEELGLTVDRDLVVTGFSEGLNSELKLTQEEMQTVLQTLDEKLNEKRQTQAAALAEKSLASSTAYLETNKAKEGVVTTESGLQYEVLTEGTGEKPVAADTVKVHYVGTLTDGTEFDSSVARGEPATFPLNRVIPGWTEGVQLMSVGSKFKFVIPSELAYGDRDTATIPANSTLVFEVELLDIQKADAPAAEASAAHAH
ncbi:peptidylprolyl isomerase [Shewanella sp. Choline-02u-19]|uniref:FKBP-type peptidyl-prolyl cis-trans isomerase n=1 Tax=unclassified Shewanella TaxID=196818 RepID=UPI000C34A35C|nr:MULTISPECIES: FKBP-type peptidyl-prolyl cis-trans isomerase [unclassified Shewanella]PKG55968.1 peptidylprolyl isomerase [Shewanella sp. GutDb-MelDb]PKG76584.1 peptidylprolyl isomerase [Shewanella sp. GutCb]PKH56216.1 peptidylprolyl isomerase [Shewanella sp. Bg11-22]PKI28714.1 peptidylprolyl isomerase [Shewanella sp. Choline-02u-19]